MGRNKAKTLYWVWKKYRTDRWGEKLREVGVVTQEDVNGFLRLVGAREEEIRAYKLGWFVSKVLEECYKGRFIELDVGAIEGIIGVGYELDWDGIIYVRGTVSEDVGSFMKDGIIVVDGVVKGFVGARMKGGLVVVNGDVGGNVGSAMEGGFVYIEGEVNKYVGYEMEGGEIVIDGDVSKDVGWCMKGGMVVVEGNVGGEVGSWMEGGEVVVNGCIGDSIGEGMKGGEIIVDGVIKKRDWLGGLGSGGLVVNNGQWVCVFW